MTNPVSAGMREVILHELTAIAAEEGVTILFAIESGSRAWGFHSRDSDYDVRFVYARPMDWHTRLDPRRDVIERPISGDLDISGWELGKALKLALGSNAVLAEWLQSPITYDENTAHRAALTAFCAMVLTRHRVGWHYMSLARRQLARLRDTDGMVRLKRYLYVIRPALALRVMRLEDTPMPPMNMAELMARARLDAAVIVYIDRMIADKLDAGEMGTAAVTDSATDAMIADEMAQAEIWLKEETRPTPHEHWAEANQLHHAITMSLS